jgi:SAM-dependent methyltransferase
MPRGRAFRVFEGGIGKVPVDLVRLAKKSLNKGKRREFIGIDREIDVNALIKRARLSKPLSNLKLGVSCATHALLALPKESTDLVYGSYLVNNLDHREASCALPQLSCGGAFFAAAHRALRPGGRLILVQDKSEVVNLRRVAENFDLRLHAIRIPDEKAAKSSSWAIRMRSSSKKRAKYNKKYDRKITQAQRAEGISSLDELSQPTIFILRKPLKSNPRLGLQEQPSEVDVLREVFKKLLMR